MTSVMLTREAREIYTKREVFPVLEVLFVCSVVDSKLHFSDDRLNQLKIVETVET